MAEPFYGPFVCPKCGPDGDRRASSGDVYRPRHVWTGGGLVDLSFPFNPAKDAYVPILYRMACINPECWYGSEIDTHEPHRVGDPCTATYKRCSYGCQYGGFLVVTVGHAVSVPVRRETVAWTKMAGV